ncbi:MAG: ABC transporter ATP-binding protein [Candidatus Nanopelagicaceae bacterium]|nr:ABC transporter ATP-binding protein [Candidatus Nanopelagicaceae bacterium]
MITIDQLTIKRDGNAILTNFSAQIPAGSITVIVGSNGSGKSTLLAAIAGDLAPDSGTIRIDETYPALASATELASLRSMAIQNQVFNLGYTVRQIIELAGPAESVMQALELSEIADRLVTTLSGGEAQRVAIAQAIAQDVPVLLLDEPLSAQDLPSRQRIITLLQTLAESGRTIVVVAHSSESELAWADQIINNF